MRQLPVGHYVADFTCRERKLIIEVDGATHASDEEIAYDAIRTRFPEAQGWYVIRFTNEDVVRLLEDVLEAWEEIVGLFLFKLSRPDSIERGVLTVRLMQPTAHHALMLEKGKILKRLQAKLPDAKIRDIRFRHG